MYEQLNDGNSDDEDARTMGLNRLKSEGHHSIIASRLLVETLRVVIGNPEDVAEVLSVIYSIANLADPIIRSELMEQIPQLAMVCDGDVGRELKMIENHLLPLVLRFLSDNEDQVRKTAQGSLLVLIEQDLLSQQLVEEEVCAVVVGLVNYCLTNGITLMGKLSQLLGKEATERLFLDKFAEACSDEDNTPVRETCAKVFGELCAVLGSEVTESKMVPLFCKLCRDEHFAVRNACADVIMLVSCGVTMETRRKILTPMFLELLSDNADWVRSSAYQVLGAFITTFAEPSITGMAYDPQGELIFVGAEGFEFRVISRHPAHRLTYVLPPTVSDPPSTTSLLILPDEEEVDEAYNTFRFWQLPVLDLDSVLDDEQMRASITSLDNELTSLSEKLDKCSSKDISDGVSEDSVILSDTSSTTDSGWNSGATTPSLSSTLPLPLRLSGGLLSGRIERKSPSLQSVNKPKQSVVPQELLDRFMQMVRPTPSADADKELAQSCAFFFPAVALAIGRENWPCISDLYRLLALDVQWKVRRRVAASLHELAKLLGEDTTSRDLAPILKSLLKDLDEVRIGVVNHLADTLRMLRPAVRNTFLPLLEDLMQTEQERNWRFRSELAKQLALACPLFPPSDCLRHIGPCAINLLRDRVVAVRKKAIFLIVQILLMFRLETLTESTENLLDFLHKEFSENDEWWRRLVFVQVCSEIASQRALDFMLFSTELLPSVLRLSQDRVPNVRISVARCLNTHLICSGYLPPEHDDFEELLKCLFVLRGDPDPDVRAAANDTADPNDSSTFTASGDSASFELAAASGD